MRIRSTDSVCGISLIRIRNALRRSKSEISGRQFAAYLRLGDGKATKLLEALSEMGIISPGTEPGMWKVTEAGENLRKAVASRPVSEAVTKRVVEKFLHRVALVNTNEEFLYRVSRTVLRGNAGPTLAEKVEIAVALERKATPESSHSMPFRSSIFGVIPWTADEVRLFLASSSSLLSISLISEIQDTWTQMVELVPKAGGDKMPAIMGGSPGINSQERIPGGGIRVE